MILTIKIIIITVSGNPYLNKPQDKYASATISKKATTIVTSTKVPGTTAPTAPVQNKQERVGSCFWSVVLFICAICNSVV